jgi:hypothetical protein
MAYAAGEIFEGSQVQKFTASAAVAKGAVITVTPAASLPTGATCAGPGAGPFAVAIEAVASGATGRMVTKGPVSVDCSGNCYTGAVVTGCAGKVKVCSTDPSGNYIKPAGRMFLGAADGGVGIVDLGVI